ncbi:Motile sperm domain-containing protein 2, partial [Globisporangium splendens]
MITASVGVNSSLLLEPAHQLTFRLDCDNTRDGAQTLLMLTNISSTKHTVFKVRTTNADMFTVKPVHGVISPGDTQTIRITVVPSSCEKLLQLDPKELATRDAEKFLIQSVERGEDMRGFDVSDLAAFWKRIPREVATNNKVGCRFTALRFEQQVAQLDRMSLTQEQWVQRQRQQQQRKEDDDEEQEEELEELPRRSASSSASALDRTINLRDMYRRRSSTEMSKPEQFETSASSEGNESDDNAEAKPQLFAIHPSETIVFHFNPDGASTTLGSSTFFVTNKSRKQALAFKIKTTNHEGYFVKPSRGLIGPANAQQVHVAMVNPSKQPVEGTIELGASYQQRQKKDRFLVEIVPVDIATYQELLVLDEKVLKRELLSIWGSADATAQCEKAMLGCRIADKTRDSMSNQNDSHDAWC